MTTESKRSTQMVFIDGGLTDLDSLLTGIDPGIEVVILDPELDGLSQIAAALAGRSELSAIHIISHGGSGSLDIGTTLLTQSNMAEYESQLAAIGAALAVDGDLLLYGCDVAQGEGGRSFIESLATVTGADVAASTDLTGAGFLGGDWVLEASTGDIETQSLDVQGYDSALATYFGTTGNDNLTGSAAADVMYGLDGNDTLNGGAGNDTLIGGAGNDLYYTDTHLDVVTENANEGVDWVYSSNYYYNLDLNPTGANIENLYMYGSTAGTTYYGYGSAGDNAIHGYASDATAVPNYLLGFGGNDTLYGYGGNDTLYGYEDNDYLYGGADQDYLSGDAGNDYLDGQAGSDTLLGGAGLDTLTGGTENDSLDGGTENDNLLGGTGNDTLQGGSGIDTMVGGTGDDQYYIDVAGDVVTELAGEGTDTIFAPFTHTLAADLENLTLTGGAVINATGNSANNTLTGNAAANILDGGAGGDTMDGGGGSDTYYVDNTLDVTGETATDAVDTVYAGTDHTIGANIENLFLTGTAYYGAGNNLANTITGNSSVNYLQGLAGNDTLLGGEGTDYLDGGAGIDSMVGGLGDDYHYVDNASDVIIENVGEGSDWVYSYVDGYTLQANFENLYVLSGTYGYGSSADNTIYGTSSNNTLYGNAGNDSLWGSSGNDLLYGGIHNDTLDGGSGADTMDGGDYDDTYYVDNTLDVAAEIYNDFLGGVDRVYASATHTLGNGIEHLTLTGSSVLSGTGNANANLITGNSASNYLYGVAGNDTLDGGDTGSGIDYLYGGLNDDTYLINDATDNVWENAGEGTDTVTSTVTYSLLWFGSLNNVENLTLSGSAAISGTGNTLGNVITGNIGNNSLSGGDGNDTLDGGAGIDTLIGGAHDDVYVVDTTTDTITDTAGIDRVDSSATFSLAPHGAIENLTLTGTAAIDATGNALNNVLTGNTGNNRLDGGTGNDTMTGGTGNDTYVVNAALDVVTEASGAGTDTVEAGVTVTLSDFVENLVLTGVSNINGTGNTLNNALTGNAGNNTLDGGAGVDTLTGGAGNDVYIVDSAGDSAVENAAEGTDRVDSVVSYTLQVNVENLTLTGTANIDGTGNAAANHIIGNTGDNILSAQAGGNDTLDGGANSSGGFDIARLSGVAGDWGSVVVSGPQGTITHGGTGQIVTLRGIEFVRFDSGADVAVILGQNLPGTAGNDSLTGTAGDDTLNGSSSAGGDTLVGGAGNDLYYVNSVGGVGVGDTVTEAADEGTDWVYVNGAISYTLPVNVENLHLISASAINGTGNSENNTIYGNSIANTLSGLDGNDYIWGSGGNDNLQGGNHNDTLDGGTGADTMNGGDQDDNYYVDNVLDVVAESFNDPTGGVDTVYASATHTLGFGLEHLVLTGSTAINGTGNANANEITGNTGINILDGGAGIDTLRGAAGDDTYIVGDSGDIIIEAVSAGTDAVQSSVNYVLSANVENMTLTGLGNINATGNAGNNALTGNAGNNRLDGGAGDDSLVGGAGNDTYVVDSALDVVTEAISADIDTIEASVSLTALAANIEHLVLTGTANIDGAGNAANNTLTGNSGNNALAGAAGDDSLYGGSGDDELQGGAGNDLLVGGIGSDVAVFSGNIANYRFGINEFGAVTVQDLVGSDGIDFLSDVQKLVFADTEVTLGSPGQFAQVAVKDVATGYSTTPTVAILAGGGHVVSWEENNKAYIQQYDALGNETGGAGEVGTWAYSTDVAALADGGFAVAYYGYDQNHNTAAGYNIRVEHHKADGSVTKYVLGDTQGGWEPEIAALQGGGFAVAWSRYSGGEYDVFAAMVDAGGVAGTAFNAANATVGQQYYAAIAGSGNGFAVSWYDGSSSANILTRRFDAAGSPLGDAVAANASWGYYPAVAGLTDGGHIVLWQGNDGYWDGVEGQRYDAAGAAVGASFTVNTTVPFTQGAPAAAALPNGGFVVVWESAEQDGSDFGIYGQRYAADGSKLDGEFRVNGITQFGQRSPDVAVADDGSFIVTWRSEGPGGGVFTQRFNADGGKVGGISITGSAADEAISLEGAAQAAFLFGGGGDDVLTGGNAADSLSGGDGADTLSGGPGADTLAGGAGNDIYLVDALDTVVENEGEGLDEVRTSINNYVLPETGVERLVLGGAAVTATGNALGNTLVGTLGNNTLTGGGGDDVLLGGRGVDEARYSGDMADYVFGVSANGAITVRHAAVPDGGDGTDTLTGIQTAHFAGGQVVQMEALASGGNGEAVTSFNASETGAVVLADGGSLVLSYGYNGTGYGINAQRFDASGVAAGASVVVFAEPVSGYTGIDKLQLVESGSGYAAVWILQLDADGAGSGDYEYSILGQLLAADGTPSGATFTVAPAVAHADRYYHVEVAGLDAGGFTVLYSKVDTYPYPLTTVSYDADGALVASTAVGTTQNAQGFVALESGGFVTLEFASEFVSATSEVPAHWEYWNRGQRHDAAGTAVGSPFDITDRATNSNDINELQSATLANGDQMLAWTIYNGTDYDLFAQVFDVVGSNWVPLLADQIDVAGGTAFAQQDVTVAARAGGGFVIAWTTSTSSQSDAYMRVFDNTGAAQTDALLVNTLTQGYQTIEDIAAGADGSFVIYFRDDQSGSRIYAQRYDADAQKIGGLELTGTENADTLKVTDALQSVQVFGNGGNDMLAGGAAADTLEGGAGNDTLDGGGGIDSLIGGSGNDTYLYTGSSDSLIELEGQGVDTVLASASFVLPETSLENIVLTAGASAALAATGNARANVLTGNEFNNTLDGLGGNDTMSGGAGNDLYVVDSASDVVTEAAGGGTDTVQRSINTTAALPGNVERLTLTGTDDLQGTGNALGNIITANSGSNVLAGGAGDDVYIIVANDPDKFDTIIEVVGEGNDTIQTGISAYSLVSVSGVENLQFTGASAATGTGNAGANSITGTPVGDTLDGGLGSDTLDGGAGADSLIGGGGDDVFEVDHAGDITHELADAGLDTVHASVSYALSTNVTTGHVDNLILTGTADINGTGNALKNVLTGNAGANRLDGGAGADEMIGGSGNDTYVIDLIGQVGDITQVGAAGDVVIEAGGAGTDTVETSVTITALFDHVENVTLTGTANVNATGNALNNTLIGNGGNNVIDGAAGDDTMTGGAGNDTYHVDSVNDVINEEAGGGSDRIITALTSYLLPANVEELLLSSTTALNATGNELANYITGNAISNDIDGRAGNDTMAGGKGDDFYHVDTTGDVVIENFGEGSDTVFTEISNYVLPINVENLVLVGSAASGTGNFLSNILTGNDGDNILNGAAGIDTMIGGLGDDVYKVDNINDLIVEQPGEGTDRVDSTISFDLASNVENLTLENIDDITLLGNGDNAATGNELANELIGNTGNNLLDGRGGSDTMQGNAGNDTYIVEEAGDVVTELAGQGTDLVRATLTSYTLGANFENLTLEVGAVNGTGNTEHNHIIGNDANNNLVGGAGDDTLDGGKGADTLVGGTGDDDYYTDNAGDVIVELSNQGRDAVYVDFRDGAAWNNNYSFTLAANVEDAFFNFVPLGLLTEIIGNTLANLLQGNDGANKLNGGAGADTMEGGGGDDIYVVGETGDVVIEDGGEGIDTVETSVNYGNGRTLEANIENLVLATGANIGTGNGLANQLVGNSGNNVLDGGSGADTLAGGSGDDVYMVDVTNDLVTENGGQGYDTVLANASFAMGNNLEQLNLLGIENINGVGNGGSNLIVGNTGSNVIDGGAGLDTMSYETAIAGVTVNLGAGQASGGGGNDILINVEGVQGSTFNDSLVGSLGDNTLNGSVGRDTMAGGAGNDIYYVDDINDVVNETDNTPAPGGGFDLSKYAGVSDTVNATVNYTLGGFIENLQQLGTANINSTGNELDNQMAGNDGDNLLQGMGGNDTLSGGAGNDTLDGGAGIDSVDFASAVAGLSILAGVVLNDGQGGTDTLISIENFIGGGFNDTLTGGSDADFLNGGAGNDQVYGDAGNDTLIGGIGDDRLGGGAGNDSIDGGTGTDTADYAAAVVGISVALWNNTVANDGQGGSDTLVSIETVLGSNFNDTLVGSAAANRFEGADGNDLIFADAGNDTLYGGNGDDRLNGGAGNDTLDGGAGVDVADYFSVGAGVSVTLWNNTVVNDGQGGSDTLISIETVLGSNFNDTLVGSTAANRFEGADGNDLLFADAGNDTLYGGNGDDRLNGGAGNDTLDGGAGVDVADYFSVGAGVSVTLWNNTVVNDGQGGSDTLVSIETVLGSNFNDTLVGSVAANRFEGADGNDLLFADAGNDTLYGGNGDDRLNGGAGNDTLDGGAGVDVADYFSVGAGISVTLWNTTVVNDGQGGSDTLVSIETVLGSNFNDTLVGSVAANRLEGADGNDLMFSDAGADTLIGGAGNDTLSGGNGSDVLTGGAGVDAFRFDFALGGANIDTITDFSVVDDTIQLENAVFTILTVTGTLAANQFHSGAGVTTAADGDDYLIYNTTTGALYYDADGNGGTASVQFASLAANPALTAGDFLVI